ncbi:MAG: response regulator [Pirellulales bacterium]|nr:response regulator [Pirellulales bacterium]
MLVLSRKENEEIVFPHLGITVEILRVAGKTVRVGVNAPQSVEILRGELAKLQENASALHARTTPHATPATPLSHATRNQLNKVSLALGLMAKQLEKGFTAQAEETLEHAILLMQQLDDSVGSEAPASAIAADRTNTFANPANKRALLVEDDPNERELLAGYLRLSGYEVQTAEDGMAALACLRERPADLVVLDMQMPRMNGAETVQAIRANPQLDHTEIVVVSGLAQHETKLSNDERGVQGWLQKPLDPAKLTRHLENTLVRHPTGKSPAGQKSPGNPRPALTGHI